MRNLVVALCAAAALVLFETPAHTITPMLSAVALAAGESHTCALTSSGGVMCWGNNQYGQLGIGWTSAFSTGPMWVTGLTSGVRAITAGQYHTCALTLSGAMYCWGNNGDSQLGAGGLNTSSPIGVSGLSSDVIAISAGGDHTCAVLSGGNVKCWGWNHYGQLANPAVGSWTPVDALGIGGAMARVDLGLYHSCAVTSGTVWCWGWNSSGQLGDGTLVTTQTPRVMLGVGADVTAVSGGQYQTCFVTGGAVTCWGIAAALANAGATSAQMSTLSGMTTGMQSVSAGSFMTCGVTMSGGAKCIGANYHGQLGDGTTNFAASAVDVVGLTSGVLTIAAAHGPIMWDPYKGVAFPGGEHTCALTARGAVKCWGRNDLGQLGTTTTSDHESTPVDVVGFVGDKRTARVIAHVVSLDSTLLSGWTVTAQNLSTGAISTQLTAADGFALVALPPGSYQICETVPRGWMPFKTSTCNTVTLNALDVVDLVFQNKRGLSFP